MLFKATTFTDSTASGFTVTKNVMHASYDAHPCEKEIYRQGMHWLLHTLVCSYVQVKALLYTKSDHFQLVTAQCNKEKTVTSFSKSTSLIWQSYLTCGCMKKKKWTLLAMCYLAIRSCISSTLEKTTLHIKWQWSYKRGASPCGLQLHKNVVTTMKGIYTALPARYNLTA